MGKRKHKIGTVFLILGSVMILSSLSLFLWNRWEDRQAGDSAQEILTQVAAVIAEGDEEAGSEDIPADAEGGTEMTEVEIDGYLYIGYLSIPSLGLDLPVMSSWSYPQLKISPCRYYGSTKTDDLVIAAHNYARHFGNIEDLSWGDAVYFTDMDGVTTAYKVVVVETLSPTAVEEMTSGGYPLTLFTCTYGGQSRVTVRCDTVE